MTNRFVKSGMIYYCILVCMLMGMISLSGCGKKKTELILTTDFEKNEVFRIERSSCYLPEVMVYLVNSENKYDTIFGAQIWDVDIDGTTMGEKYKDSILAKLAQIKVMNLMAKEQNVVLTDDDILRIKAAARDYYNSLNDKEKELLMVDEDIIYNLYCEFAVANKLYHEITDDVAPEISDDEARILTVRDILIKTYKSSVGKTVSYNEAEKAEAYDRIFKIKQRLDEGEDFDIIAESTENEDTKIEYSFGRGVMPEVYEEAAFSLGPGEISGIIETDYGYHILKCITTYDQEQTDKNKEVIIKERKQEAFNDMYDQYVMTLKTNLNGDLWDSVTYVKTPDINTTDFFDIYNSYFTTVTELDKLNN